MDLNKEVFVFKFNWAAILAFAIFWSYGFFGALTSKSFGLTANIIISLVLFGVFILFLWLWKNNDSYKDGIIIKNKDILVFASFFLIMLVLSFNNLTMPLNGDQLAHSQQSKLHSIKFVDFLSNKSGYFDNFSFKWLIHIVDLLIIFAGFLVYKFTKEKKWMLKIASFSLLFLFFRFSIIALGGSAGPHPSLRLFPLWLTSAIFGSNDFSFRLAQFIGLICLIWLVQRISEKRLSFINSWFFALAVGTIPVLWHVGILAEQSIWTAVSWTLFLLYFLGDKNNTERQEIDYVRWISIISIFTMMRQSAFVALAPIFLILAVDLFKKRKFFFKKIFILISPVLAMFPFLLHSVIVGTPATYLGETSSLQRVWTALDSGIIFNAIMNSISWPWVALLIFILLLIRNNSLGFSVISIFFISGVYIFYMITPGLWGMGRYQAEYAIPFIILGFFILVNFMAEHYNLARKLLPMIFVVLIMYNIYIFENLAVFNRPVDELKTTFSEDIKTRGGYAILSEFPYKYRQALKEAKKAGYAGEIFIAGVTYGVFSEILNDFTISEVKSEKQIYEEVQIDFSAENIDKNSKIRLVLISDFDDSGKLKNDLENSGWQKWKEFKNNEYRSTIFGLIRGNI